MIGVTGRAGSFVRYGCSGPLLATHRALLQLDGSRGVDGRPGGMLGNPKPRSLAFWNRIQVKSKVPVQTTDWSK